MAFVKQKFLSLSQERQIKKIFDLVTEIDKNWHHEKERIENLKILVNYADWIEVQAFKILAELSLEADKHAFYQLIAPLQNAFQIHLKDADFIIFQEDKKPANPSPKIPVTVCLVNLRSAFNVGSIFRTAECFQLEKIVLTGYTPTPNEKKTQTTAMGTENLVDWEHRENICEVIECYKRQSYAIFALETTSNALLIAEIPTDRPILLLLGNEALGLSKEILQLCDAIFEIPLFGWKNSLNVGTAFAIVAYEVRGKFEIPTC
jgi:tRNA G18 (ribose-2'-O)-methylase SpoU